MKYISSNEEVKNSYKSSSIIMNNMTPILFLIFLVLKLTKQIDWSWWWVTSPLWISLALLVVIVLVVIITRFVIVIYKTFINKYNEKENQTSQN